MAMAAVPELVDGRGLAAAGAWGNRVAWWSLLVAVVLTWVSGLDYARAAPALFRGGAGSTTPA